MISRAYPFCIYNKAMPDYFGGYETKVKFISQEDLDKNHKGMPHGVRVIRE